jgi:hypothetical protein
MRTLSYPLPATRLTRRQCEAIMAPLLQYCLPAMGICRNFPRKLVFSTLEYMGLDIKHLFIVQEIIRVKDIIFHTFNNTLTGKLYRNSMELFFIELGINPADLPKAHSKVETLTTPSLVQSTMLFLAQFNIQLKHSITLTPLRNQDQYIMEALLQLELPDYELKICNHCRLYLKGSLGRYLHQAGAQRQVLACLPPPNDDKLENLAILPHQSLFV